MRGAYLKRKTKKITEKLKKNFEQFWFRLKGFFISLFVSRRDFSVISNNCWGGWVYRILKMPYLSPTAGLFFMSGDYLKLVKNLHKYMDAELEFIPAESSRYYEYLKERNFHIYPIARLDDIEVVFRHYKTPEEAAEKWNRRKSRINYDNIIFKFSRMYGCTEKEMAEFAALDFKNKILINNRKDKKYDCEIYAALPADGYGIINDTQPFPGKVNIIKILNRAPERYPDNGLNKK